ncbi:MAG TPA: lytic transglycosylase domain-containing protein [Woeseiaceae bacterium]|jgi:hypothetical protein|nr:lytic transglycosylase domain-containing protein [Woeseiaceae bacterium]
MRATKIRTLCAGLVVALLAMSASAKLENLDARWSDYAQQKDSFEPAYTFPHSTCFKAAALRYDLPETLLLAVARGESDFEPTARSRANAHGVMQILWPGTARHLGIHRLSELYDPCTNIDAGARYLRELTDNYDGNLHLALAAYNYGPSRISKSGYNIPSGAEWYSAYIYRHLNYVIGEGTGRRPVPDTLYSDIGQSTLLTFGEPYRAEAFIERLEKKAPAASLDWFRRGTGEFEVVMTYANREEFDSGARQLRNAGFRID